MEKQESDPVHVAAYSLAFTRLWYEENPCRPSADDRMPRQWMKSERELTKAEGTFASAVPTTPRGAIHKLRYALGAVEGHGLEAEHIRGVITYLKRLTT